MKSTYLFLAPILFSFSQQLFAQTNDLKVVNITVNIPGQSSDSSISIRNLLDTKELLIYGKASENYTVKSFRMTLAGGKGRTHLDEYRNENGGQITNEMKQAIRSFKGLKQILLEYITITAKDGKKALAQPKMLRIL